MTVAWAISSTFRSNLCYSAEKTLRENKDKLQAGDVSQLEALIQEGKKAVEQQDDGAIASVTERLEKEAHRVASAMYQGGAPGNGPAPSPRPPNGSAEPGRTNVVDAEFEETHGHP